MHSKFLFIIVFFIDFLLSAFNFISNFITKEINSAQLCDSLLYSFLGLLPIVPLGLISAKITKMSDVKKLLFTKFILIVYLIIDISSGVLLYNPHFPKYIRIPFELFRLSHILSGSRQKRPDFIFLICFIHG